MLKKITELFCFLVFLSVVFTVGCSAQQTEEQALKSLRDLTSNGKLPPENVVADIESRFAGRKTGTLAKLLRARIKFENQDFAGAAAILNSDVFRNKTHLADHALWLRGKALQLAGDHGPAMEVLAKMLRDFPESIRVRDAKLMWSTSSIAAGRAVDVLLIGR